MYNDQLVYKVVIQTFFWISLWKKKVALIDLHVLHLHLYGSKCMQMVCSSLQYFFRKQIEHAMILKKSRKQSYIISSIDRFEETLLFITAQKGVPHPAMIIYCQNPFHKWSIFLPFLMLDILNYTIKNLLSESSGQKGPCQNPVGCMWRPYVFKASE